MQRPFSFAHLLQSSRALACTAGLKTLFALTLALILSRSAAQDLQAATTVVRPGYENTVGEGSQAPLDAGGARRQNIYSANDLISAMPFGGTILQIAFRIDERNRSSFSAMMPDLEIRMSTSQAGFPNKISIFYAENVGPDETVVFGRGPAQFTVAGSETGVNPFDIKFPLAKPFTYDPRKGNLVVDFLLYKDATRGLLLDTAGGVAREGFLNVDFGLGLSDAPIMEVTFNPVPEPLPCILILMGIAVLLGGRKA